MPDTSELPPPRLNRRSMNWTAFCANSKMHHTLEDSLARYERGVALLRQCYGQLRDAEQRVKVLAAFRKTAEPS